MKHVYLLKLAAGRQVFRVCLGLLLATSAARAQAPVWSGIATDSYSSSTIVAIRAATTDASGNVFVTGEFYGNVVFGSIALTGAGYSDIFVAKYVPSTGTWAWAQRGGGDGIDSGNGIAVSGNSVYVTGRLFNDTKNTQGVLFGGISPATSRTQVNGATPTASTDLLLAKYTDNGSSATLSWTQVGGGTDADVGNGVAASNGSVYVVGTLFNNTLNNKLVVFGGGGTTAGTTPVNGATPTAGPDLLLAKYTDNGSSATLGWTQVGGGTSPDYGNGIAVSGGSVYVTGQLFNSTNNSARVLFGGAGTTPGTVRVNGAYSLASPDLLLAKYTDNGSSATLGWTQVGGGSRTDYGKAVAASGPNVYVTGGITNTSDNGQVVLFGGGGTTAGTTPVSGALATPHQDLVLAKYTDLGSTARLGWTQVGGGLNDTYSEGLTVSGSSVYVTGQLINDASNTQGVLFGGNGTTAGTVPVAGAANTVAYNLLLTKYFDQGSTGQFAWGLTGGGAASSAGYGVVVSGRQVYVAGSAETPATFGPATVTAGYGSILGVLPYLTDLVLTPLAARGASAGTALTLYPNPTSGVARLAGISPGTTVQVLDALGRLVGTALADGRGAAALPGGLVPGVYVVRAGGQVARLVVE